ncbi:unnamed protein product [Cercospora beticola]|nr:unnamed protein product [Cercospora beticola]
MDTLPTELVENILWFLPEKDLLLVQRVSTYWRHIVKTSPRLQHAPFYSPTGMDRWLRWASVPTDEGDVLVHGITPEVGHGHDPIYIPFREQHERLGTVFSVPLHRLNPLLFHQPTPSSIFTTMDRRITRIRIDPMILKNVSNASCKKMYLCQPSISTVYYSWSCDHVEIELPDYHPGEERERGFIIEGEMRNEDGVTMENVLNEMTARGPGPTPSTPFTLSIVHCFLVTARQEQYLSDHPHGDNIGFDRNSLHDSLAIPEDFRPEYYKSEEQLKQAMASCSHCALNDGQEE